MSIGEVSGATRTLRSGLRRVPTPGAGAVELELDEVVVVIHSLAAPPPNMRLRKEGFGSLASLSAELDVAEGALAVALEAMDVAELDDGAAVALEAMEETLSTPAD